MDPLQKSRLMGYRHLSLPNPPRLRAYCPELRKGPSPFSPLSHRKPPALFAEIEVRATAVAFRQTVRLLRGAELISREGSAASYVQ